MLDGNSLCVNLVHRYRGTMTRLVSPQGDGTFTVKLRAHQAGVYAIKTWVAGCAWRNLSCLVKVLPGVVSPTMCRVFGSGLVQAKAGEIAKFTIEARLGFDSGWRCMPSLLSRSAGATSSDVLLRHTVPPSVTSPCLVFRRRDTYGNRCMCGGDSFSVTLVPDMDNVSIKAARAQVRDLEDGTYEAAYRCTKTGPYGIVVNFLGSKREAVAPQAIAAAQVRRERKGQRGG